MIFKSKKAKSRRKSLLTTPERALRKSVLIIGNGPRKLKASTIKLFNNERAINNNDNLENCPPSPDNSSENKESDWLDWNNESEEETNISNNISDETNIPSSYDSSNFIRTYSYDEKEKQYWQMNYSILFEGVLNQKYGFELVSRCCSCDLQIEKVYDCKQADQCFQCFEISHCGLYGHHFIQISFKGVEHVCPQFTSPKLICGCGIIYNEVTLFSLNGVERRRFEACHITENLLKSGVFPSSRTCSVAFSMKLLG